MIADVFSLLRRTVRLLLSGNAPGQLAAGFTIGMMIGVMPKANLIALSLCLLLFATRANKGLGLAAAIAFSFVGPWLDPLADRLGLAVLSIQSMQSTFAAVLNAPLGPWIGFNNTVVAGSFVIGIYITYPVYWLARIFFGGLRAVFVRSPGERLGFDPELQPRVAA